MTIEYCIGFCGDQNYIYAGVEFASESNCDSTIQFPSVPAPLDNCNWGCSGNNSETCGASGKINIFYSGATPPVIVPSVSATGGEWDYDGCFTDSTSARTLAVPVNIPGGVTPESCTAACQALGSYSYAGLEIGRECWCDNAVNPPTQRVSDADCRMVCDSNHEEYCGNVNRLAIYQLGSSGGGGDEPQECNESTTSSFTLTARNRNDGTITPLKVIVVELVKSLTWTLLSVSGLSGT
ncbi:WSC-domain-containing protein [Pluteus cervinus]|uniref:WSC-domain-containing protein n=1 Tax=Pluteus cervinus TaxID=181527 RepID=A0ACD3A9S8_9AGAR|nr:WSC-domain-containing protein [Pluteus cervinus]